MLENQARLNPSRSRISSGLQLLSALTMGEFSGFTGYDPSFLGVELPFPTFEKDLEANLLVVNESANDASSRYYLPYIHYSVATNTRLRQPVITAV